MTFFRHGKWASEDPEQKRGLVVIMSDNSEQVFEPWVGCAECTSTRLMHRGEKFGGDKWCCLSCGKGNSRLPNRNLETHEELTSRWLPYVIEDENGGLTIRKDDEDVGRFVAGSWKGWHTRLYPPTPIAR